MKLRIVSGNLKGRVLSIPDRDTGFRPTRERIREAVSNILSSRLRDASVADICAGSGAFGFEMISRGARQCVFVENDRYRLRLLREHADRFGVSDRCRFSQSDIRGFIRDCTDRFDLIYFDPPYDDPVFIPMVSDLLGLLSGNGILVHEHRNRRGRTDATGFDATPVPYDLRTYGETAIRFYRQPEPAGTAEN
ncbi:MAG: RsmD family RNA methyltransferase [Chitinispirillaceae bacterium]|nr:RsmD family RNA methyltransferase [Chitinispirillaceae bacterium]